MVAHVTRDILEVRGEKRGRNLRTPDECQLYLSFCKRSNYEQVFVLIREQLYLWIFRRHNCRGNLFVCGIRPGCEYSKRTLVLAMPSSAFDFAARAQALGECPGGRTLEQ